MRTWQPYSGSNPAPGILTALRDLYAKDRKMAIFVFGDEYQSDDFDEFLKEVDRGVAARTLGGASLRIHAIGFWNQGFEARWGCSFRCVVTQFRHLDARTHPPSSRRILGVAGWESAASGLRGET